MNYLGGATYLMQYFSIQCIESGIGVLKTYMVSSEGINEGSGSLGYLVLEGVGYE